MNCCNRLLIKLTAYMITSAVSCALGISPGSIYRDVVARYARELGMFSEEVGPHSLRATAATNALEQGFQSV